MDSRTQQLSGPHSPNLLVSDVDTKTIVGLDALTDGGLPKTVVPIGGQIGKYQIRSQLGTGGMGAVYLAFDPLIEREVAIKILTQEVGASAVALQRFLQEARAIGRLNHPNVVSIFDIDQWNGHYYLVMEVLSGGSLAQTVEQKGPLPWKDACRMIAQAASGLAAAHDAGMVHRDIKPENLMLTSTGLVKVVDFGLSKLVDAANDTRTAVTKQGQILGTPQYMSPEQFDAAEVDSRTDIYSLGASLFRLLTARFPYQDCASIIQTMMAHMNKPIPAATAFDPQIPVECDWVIAKAMAKRPADRYRTAHEMADELMELVRSRRGPIAEPKAPVAVATSGVADASARNAPSAVNAPNAPPAAGAADVFPLDSVVIVEPSRMLAAMMKDAVTRVGAGRVEVVASKGAAVSAVQSNVPDLLITAKELPDGLGIDLVSDVCSRLKLSKTCIVLNSSDSMIDDLIQAAESAGGRILAPKKVRPDDVLRVLHAAGPCRIGEGSIAMPIDPLSLRLVIVTDFGKVPESLAETIRQLELLDVAVLSAVDVASIPTDDAPTVVLRLRMAGRSVGDDQVYASMSAWLPGSPHLLAEIQVDAGKLYLRAIFRRGVTASVSCTLDADRLARLLQACRST
jgi:CheY-like chemotaxis protein